MFWVIGIDNFDEWTCLYDKCNSLKTAEESANKYVKGCGDECPYREIHIVKVKKSFDVLASFELMEK